MAFLSYPVHEPTARRWAGRLSHAPTGRSPGRLASLPDPLFITAEFGRRLLGPSSFMRLHVGRGRSGNALNTRRRRRSVNDGESDSLSVRRRRVGRRTGRHAQCWEKSKLLIISDEIDSLSINQIELKSNRNSINRTITSVFI